MLPRPQRVTTELFAAILARGETIHSAHFYLRLLKSASITPSIFSVVVPKKIEATAARRNQAKRRTVSILHSELKNIKPGFQGLVFLKKDARTLVFKEAKDEIQLLLKKANLL